MGVVLKEGTFDRHLTVHGLSLAKTASRSVVPIMRPADTEEAMAEVRRTAAKE